MQWKKKAAVFRFLSILPFGHNLHYYLQKHVTKNWPRKAFALGELKVAAEWIIQNYGKYGNVSLAKAHFIEIGAGRDLALAIALRLMGVAHITCLDVDQLAKPELIAHAAQYMAAQLGKAPPVIRDWADLESFGITYQAPLDLTTVETPNHSYDCFYSADTLEHIPFENLKGIMQASRRLLKPGGVSIHMVDYSDHYAESDPQVSRFNFLQYTKTGWGPYNSRFHYVNRLRHSQYVDLIKSSGFTVTYAEPDISPIEDKILANLAPEFERFTHDDLFTMRAKLIAS